MALLRGQFLQLFFGKKRDPFLQGNVTGGRYMPVTPSPYFPSYPLKMAFFAVTALWTPVELAREARHEWLAGRAKGGVNFYPATGGAK